MGQGETARLSAGRLKRNNNTKRVEREATRIVYMDAKHTYSGRVASLKKDDNNRKRKDKKKHCVLFDW